MLHHAQPVTRANAAAIGRKPGASLRFLPDRTIQDPDEPIDTLLVAGDPSFGAIDPAITAWIKRRAPEIRRFGSVCTGVFLLAAAGLLDGRRVTTHWECAERLRSEFPNLILDADKIFICDGNLSTTAGVTAGMDLALALVEEDYGRDVALIVARYMVMFLKRPGGQSQFSTHLAAQMTGKTSLQKVLDYILENLQADLSIDKLAMLAGMSSRNLSRVFRKEVGMTPLDFIEATRIDAARLMLQDTSEPLQRISYACGFGTVDNMRRVFVRNLGVGPLEYRNTFRTAWPAAAPGRAFPEALSPKKARPLEKHETHRTNSFEPVTR